MSCLGKKKLCGTALTVVVILASSLYGWNIHIWDLKFEQMVSGRQVSLAAQILFILSTSIAKCSILVSYLRLAPQGSWFRKLTCTSLTLIKLPSDSSSPQAPCTDQISPPPNRLYDYLFGLIQLVIHHCPLHPVPTPLVLLERPPEPP